MAEDRTIRRPTGGLPVRSLRVEVVGGEGADAGRALAAESETVTVGTAQGNDLVLADPTVSRYHLELVCTPDGIRIVDLGSTNGTLAGAIRIERATVPPGTVLSLGDTALRVGEGADRTVDLHASDSLGEMRGRTPVMRRLMARIERAARSDVSVLVVGESGTGKELVARALHGGGPRAERPFVTVDCGALAPTLVASELFGHERGAFTGADRQHVGAFERANGGTLFLDEVGELPAALQSTLLGVLERRSFRRLGGRVDLVVDVRVVAATNRDLRADVNSGAFRLDLYYRLAVVVMQLPPLRERVEDIPLLVEHFLRECGHDGPVEDLISAKTMESLRAHTWAGNVRELRNLVEATVAMGEAPGLDEALARPRPDIAPGEELLGLPYRQARTALLADFESRYLRDLLRRADGNVARAAREARMDRSYLVALLRRHGLR